MLNSMSASGCNGRSSGVAGVQELQNLRGRSRLFSVPPSSVYSVRCSPRQVLPKTERQSLTFESAFLVCIDLNS
jgi:hypothetical protein